MAEKAPTKKINIEGRLVKIPETDHIRLQMLVDGFRFREAATLLRSVVRDLGLPEALDVVQDESNFKQPDPQPAASEEDGDDDDDSDDGEGGDTGSGAEAKNSASTSQPTHRLQYRAKANKSFGDMLRNLSGRTGGSAPILVIVVCVVVTLGSMGYLASQMLGGGRSRSSVGSFYFLDVNAGVVREAGLDETPPIGPNNTGMIRAHVFSCGDCSRARERFVGYVERFNPERAAAAPDASAASPAMAPDDHGYELASYDEQNVGKWVARDTAEAIKLQSSAAAKCQQGKFVRCNPDW